MGIQHIIMLLAGAVFVFYPIASMRLRGREAAAVFLLQVLFFIVALFFAKGLSAIIAGDPFFLWLRDPNVLEHLYAGMRFQGVVFAFGFVVMPLLLLFAGTRHRDSVWRYLDHCALAMAATYAIVCANCFINGCCVGEVGQHFWYLEYPRQSVVYWQQVSSGLIPPYHRHSQPVLPVHLLLATLSLVGYIGLRSLLPKERFRGEVYAWYLFALQGLIGLVDGLRAPYDWELQAVSFLMSAIGGLLLFNRFRSRQRLLSSLAHSE